MKSSGYVLKERAYTGPVAPPDSFEDESRFGNDGVHTAITWVRHPSSGLWVRSFNGTSSRIDCGGDASLLFDHCTYEAWVYCDGPAAEADQFIFWRSGTHYPRMSHYTPTDRLYTTWPFTLAGNISVLSIAGDCLQQKWNYMTAIWDGSFVRIYIDAIEINTSADLTGDSLNIANNLYISRSDRYWWNGKMALVRLYNYALSPTAIGKHFEAERRFFGV